LILPCTPAGCIELLKQNNIKISQTNVVVIGRSNIVGKPIAALFLLEDATVTVCHSKTLNLKEVCKKADILICAIGKAKFINSEYTNQNQTIIDVGMNVDENNKLCGDVDYNDVKDKVFAITPVPGGVGPMTISILMKNLISVTKHQNEITN
jgi:5,10-methylene-tetrahydrofolate dehydrogenase/methenyl tetrahydrofolate cyclohydrolase